MRPRFPLALLLLLSALCAQSLFAQTKPPAKPTDPLTAADQAYARKSYAVALSGYRQGLSGKLVPARRRPEVELRVARCLGLTKQWDAAVSEAQRFAAKYAGTVWEARAHAWQMALYRELPHEAWKVGERFYRGRDVPETDAATQPEQVDLRAEDMRKAVEYGEQAKKLYEKLRGTDSAEEADLAADLARVVADTRVWSWAADLKWATPSDPIWTLEPHAAYDPSWPPPRKVLQLFLAAEELGSKKQKPLARLMQAMWLRSYQGQMEQIARREVDGTPEPIPYPYQDRVALDVLRSFLRDYITHPEADHGRIMAAEWLTQDGKYAEALAVYRAFLKERPASKWASDARADLAAITRTSLQVIPPYPQAPGKKAALDLLGRNLEKVTFTAHRIRLEDVAQDPRAQKPDAGVEDVLTWAKGKAIEKFYVGNAVTWNQAVAPKTEYAPTSHVETPLTQNGAYVVHADAGPAHATVLLVISDLAAVQIVEAGKVHLMAANAQSGVPVTQCSVLVREDYDDAKGKERVHVGSATTDADGQFEQPLKPDGSVRTFVWKGSRYAFTGQGWMSRFGYSSGERPETKVYAYTDRPVYRPGQTVYYRALLADRAQDGDWKPLAGTKVRVQVRDVRGATIHTADLTTGDFGTVNGTLELSAGVPLGGYALIVSPPDARRSALNGNGMFRVEDYKKPEFEVAIVPGHDGPTRVGDPITAKISARYYFGQPVVKAKVSYNIRREEWMPESPFHEPYSYLYAPRDRQEQAEEDQDWQGEWVPVPEGEVARGTAITNEHGEAEVKLDTSLNDPRLKGRHLKFTIHAEVTDASRRTIEGEGEVRALATQFNAFMHVRRGFYSVGDHLQADIRTLDAEGRPISVRGTALVSRLTARDDKVSAQEIHREPLRTDADGRATFTWTPDLDGSYEVRFEARDAWEQRVMGRERAWVAGDASGDGVFHNRHVLLVPEQNTYRLGQKARVLLVADEPGSTVLLTQEAGSHVVDKRVVRIPGRTLTLEIPLTRKQSPDIVLAATGIRDREYFRTQTTLYVPPAEKLLNVEVTADRKTYKPGEKATLHVRARDADGRPVRTEASVGVVDASVFYIQGEAAGPAGFYYAEERQSQLDAQESLSGQFGTVETNETPPVKGERHAWSLPAGLGSLPDDWDAARIYAARANPFAINMELGARVPTEQALSRLRVAPAMMPAAAAPVGMGAAAADTGIARHEDSKGAMALSRKTLDMSKLKQRDEPAVRSNFADTAFWAPAVTTDANGEATVQVTWPDNLTQWHATTRAWSSTAQVGDASLDVSTSKDLLVRLQAPRFFVERDEVVLSANVHNYTQEAKRIRVALQMDGDTLVPASSSSDGAPGPRPLNIPRADLSGSQNPPESGGRAAEDAEAFERWIDVPKDSEKRVDWRVRVERSGEARLRVTADGGPDSDGVEMKFPVLAHGVEKLIVRSGAMLTTGTKPDTRTAKLTVNLPAERAPGSGELIVQLSPSIAATMLDALPYLVDYPYGCVEQTLDRFVPSVVCAKTLTDLGVSLDDLQKRSRAEYARLKETPKDRPENSAYSYAEGRPGERNVARMAREMWLWRAEKSPVYNPAVLRKMVTAGMARLRRFQHRDGGWGWWEDDESDPLMTAQVLHGLSVGKASGLDVPPVILQRGFAFLDARFGKLTELHDAAFAGYVLTLDRKRAAAGGQALLARVYPRRETLTAYSLSLLALGLKQSGHAAQAAVCLENLENTAKIDREAGTCSWSRNSGHWWEWQNDDVETAAMCLRAMNSVDPKNPLAPMVVRWLANNRSGSAWYTTKQTALAVEALAEYVRLNRELAPDYTAVVEAGSVKRSFELKPENALVADNRLVIPASTLKSGSVPITVTRKGHGALYYSAYLRYFTLEEGIRGAGNEIRVRRRYFKLTKSAGAPPADTPRTTDGYVRALLRPGDHVSSGDLLDVELLIESKNQYQYLVFEDMKPAGCEPVELRSGETYGGGLCSNMELRDEKVAFFISKLPQGKRIITYRLRAELPGAFHALPLNGYAMYSPAVRCISDEGNLGIDDLGP